MKLYIVSLKKFFIKDGCVHTYGGFGEYVKMFLDDFDEVHLCVPLSPHPIGGGYILEHEKLKYHFLPFYKNELGLLVKSPVIFVRLLSSLWRADVINPRIPDMTGVYGWVIGKIYRKPMFVSLQSDISNFLEDSNSTKLRGVVRKGLFLWLRIYLFFEERIMKNALSFPQGKRLVDKYCGNNPSAIPWVSSALHDDDINIRKCKISIKKKSRITLLNVGRLTRQKNQKMLVTALGILHSQGYKNVYLNIVGKFDSNIYDEIIEEARRQKIQDFVNFFEPVEHGPDLWEIFDDADIFVFSSIFEGTPKVILEALGRSLPVVSTDVGGIPSVIRHEHNGLLSEKNDVNSLSKNIGRFIEMESDELNNFIANGISEVGRYTVRYQKRRIIDALYKHGVL